MLTFSVHLECKVVELLIEDGVSLVVRPIDKLLVEQSPEDNRFPGLGRVLEVTYAIKDSSDEVVRIELIVRVVFLLTIGPSSPCAVNSTSHTLMHFLSHEASLDTLPEHLPGNLLGRVCIVLDVGISKVLLVEIPPGNILSFGVHGLVVASVLFVVVNRAGHAAIVEQHPAFVKLGVVKSVDLGNFVTSAHALDKTSYKS
jgi:hypothetical protein